MVHSAYDPRMVSRQAGWLAGYPERMRCPARLQLIERNFESLPGISKNVLHKTSLIKTCYCDSCSEGDASKRRHFSTELRASSLLSTTCAFLRRSKWCAWSGFPTGAAWVSWATVPEIFECLRWDTRAGRYGASPLSVCVSPSLSPSKFVSCPWRALERWNLNELRTGCLFARSS